MIKTRKPVCAALLLLLSGLSASLAPDAFAHTRSVTLTAADPFRGYEVRVRAVKDDEDEVPVRIAVVLRNGVQTHQYSFDAPRSALRFGPNLGSGTLRLASLSDESGGYGGGTIRFEASAPLRTVSCADGAATLRRPQVRTQGGLRFSPTQTEANRFVRTEWNGRAEELRSGGCLRPLVCKPADRLSAFRTEEIENFAVLAWRYRAGGPLKVQGNYFQVDPDGPAYFVKHTRTVRVDRSRFSVTGFSNGAVDLAGVPGFGGSFTVDAEGEPQPVYGPCEAEMIEGTAEGTVTTAFTFAPDQTASSWSGGMIYKDT